MSRFDVAEGWPVKEEARAIVIEVAKHLVTLTVASIGFLVTLMFTTFRGTPYILSAQVSLFALLLCVVFSVLTQMAVVEDALGSRPMIKWLWWGPRTLLTLAWISLVIGISAFVIFTWANINLP
jgi:hypothetical protein